MSRTWTCLGVGVVLASLGGCAGPAMPVYDVPRLANVQIDGEADDWADRGFRVEMLAGQHPKDPKDLRGDARIAWSEHGLLVLVNVRDDVAVENESLGSLWRNDSVELFLRPGLGAPDLVQVVIAPGRDPRFGEARVNVHDLRLNESLKAVRARAEARCRKVAGGYAVEALLPWDCLGIAPKPLREVAFQLYVNDSDGLGPKHQLTWFPAADSHANPSSFHRLRLAGVAGPPVRAAVSGGYEQLARVKLEVAAVSELAGRRVDMRDGWRVLDARTLSPAGGWARATLRAPMPPPGRPYGPIEVRMDGRLIGVIELRDPDEARARAWMERCPTFASCVLSGEDFPACLFDDSLLAEELVGPYEIEVSYYDAAHNPVARAKQPGRYGAVIRIRAADGRIHTRFRTLFRSPDEPAWRQWDPKLTFELPEGLGITAEAAQQYRSRLDELLKWSLVEQMRKDHGAAVVLAAMHEFDPASPPVAPLDDPWVRDRQWWVEMKRRLNGNDKRFAEPFICPRAEEGAPAPVLRDGPCAEAGMSDDAPARLDAVLSAWAIDSGQPFVALVARRGVIVHHKAYGSREGRPMDIDTPTWMASITKLMHGACITMLVDQGLVNLDQPICKYLPEFLGAGVRPPMTVRHLVTHTAGMWGHWGDEASDLEHLVAGYGPNLEVARRHRYNGMSLSLASKILEQVTAEALPAFYRRRLLDPLGLKHTTVANSHSDAMMTAHDLAVFAQMLVNGGAYGDKRFFSAASRDAMLPRPLAQALRPEAPLPRGLQWGIGCQWFGGEGLGERTFGHGAASSATLRIDLDNELIAVIARDAPGRNFKEHHEKFLRTVGECVLAPPKP